MEAWEPKYDIPPAIAAMLMRIEAARGVVERTPLPLAAEARLREQARLRSTHYSTAIEGNRLTLAEAREALGRREAFFAGRERDVSEVRNYWAALQRAEEWAARRETVSELLIRRLHAQVEYGKRTRPTPYREGQNVIRDSESSEIVYLPPEARDVPRLMAAMTRWISEAEKSGRSGSHYRRACPLSIRHNTSILRREWPHRPPSGNLYLHRGGYGLHGFLSIEEHHARDLTGYYTGLVHASASQLLHGAGGAGRDALGDIFHLHAGATFKSAEKRFKEPREEREACPPNLISSPT